MAPTPEEQRSAARATWSAGDYPELAKTIEDCSHVVVDRSGAGEGHALLDVATGTGNAALEAARRGARVTGLDITPDLLAVAGERAEREGLTISFDEGDAADLPYEDDSFDRVVSVFGAMFVPNQAAAASELLRVCRPGGTVVVAAWTPDGLNGQMFGTLAAHLPPPPKGLQPPILWGTEERVRELFADGEEVGFETEHAAQSAASVNEWLDHLEVQLGPLLLAKQALETEGRWDAARTDLAALFERFNEADDGTLEVRPTYLLSSIRKPG